MSQYEPQSFRMLPPVVKHLLIINLIVFLATMVLERYGYSNITSMLALNSVATGRFRFWQLFTYMFMHAGWSHILFNMFALWMFGYVLENFWGSRRFLVYYLVCGIGAGVCNLLVPGWGLTVGASTQASVFLTSSSIKIFILGAASFCVATAGGLLGAKLMNLFLKEKINPMIGAAGVSAVPDSARVVEVEGQKYDPSNHLLMHAMAPNVSGVIGSAVAAGVMMSFLMM